jgi:hypothetical protein
MAILDEANLAAEALRRATYRVHHVGTKLNEGELRAFASLAMKRKQTQGELIRGLILAAGCPILAEPHPARVGITTPPNLTAPIQIRATHEPEGAGAFRLRKRDPARTGLQPRPPSSPATTPAARTQSARSAS